jgi:hypothetical protein
MKQIQKRFWTVDEWAEEHYDVLMIKKNTGVEHIPLTFVERGIVVY